VRGVLEVMKVAKKNLNFFSYLPNFVRGLFVSRGVLEGDKVAKRKSGFFFLKKVLTTNSTKGLSVPRGVLKGDKVAIFKNIYIIKTPFIFQNFFLFVTLSPQKIPLGTENPLLVPH